MLRFVLPLIFFVPCFASASTPNALSSKASVKLWYSCVSEDPEFNVFAISQITERKDDEVTSLMVVDVVSEAGDVARFQQDGNVTFSSGEPELTGSFKIGIRKLSVSVVKRPSLHALLESNGRTVEANCRK